jgi:hypothetical protein
LFVMKILVMLSIFSCWLNKMLSTGGFSLTQDCWVSGILL